MRLISVLLVLVICVADLACSKGYFWHITDVHYQPAYYVGANIKEDCVSGTGDAGPYGSLGPCDLPLAALEDTFQFMRDTYPAPDFIFYTGDMIPHNPGSIKWAGVIEYQQNVTYYFQKYFPGVKVYPILGNHDTYPEFQMWDYEYWLFDYTAEAWSPFLDSTMQATFVKGGYYTTVITPGLRLVAVNTALYYDKNLEVDPTIHTDPAGQIAWLTGVLTTAKQNNEKVFMIYHVPAGYNAGLTSQFYKTYNEMFVSSLDPYNSIIIGHFMGHDHLDMFRIFGDLTTPKLTSAGFAAGSLSPWYFANPRMRLFTYNNVSPFSLTDFTSYQYDVKEANANNRIDWYIEYIASIEYGLDDLSGASLVDLYHRMQENSTLVDVYLKHWKGVEWVGEMCAPFSVCREAAVCSIGSSMWVPWAACMGLESTSS